MSSFHLIDLASQREAGRELLRGKSPAEVVAWLKAPRTRREANRGRQRDLRLRVAYRPGGLVLLRQRRYCLLRRPHHLHVEKPPRRLRRNALESSTGPMRRTGCAAPLFAPSRGRVLGSGGLRGRSREAASAKHALPIMSASHTMLRGALPK